MINLAQVKDISTRALGTATITLKKYSPQILTGIGILGTVGTVVLSGRAAIKAVDILDEAKQTFATIETVAETADATVYSEEDHKRDILVTGIQTGGKLAAAYAPAIGTAALSIGCFLAAEGILNRRYVAAMGLYEACNGAFDGYRKRVADIYGSEAEDAIFRNLQTTVSKTKVTDENGKSKTVSTTTVTQDKPNYSIYARCFDEGNPFWSRDASQNKWFLECKQTALCNKLKANGYLFLNEVYRELGFKEVPMGQLVGWRIDGNGDGYVDFGMYDISKDSEAKIQFMNAENPCVFLDFNVDGVIYDRI